MVRSIAVAAVLSCLATPSPAQAQPAPGTAAKQAGTPAVKPTVKKPAPKSKTAAKPPPTEGGRCDLGVIAAAGSPIGLKKIGITIFGNEYFEVPSDAWGIDDLIVARVRAAAGAGIAVRRIAYAKEAFDTYNHPEKRTISDARENFTAIVRQVAGNNRCARYIVVARSVGDYPGTNQSLAGIGVVTHGPFGRATVFDYFSVTVLDGQTFAIRDDPFGSFGARLSTSLARFVKDEFLRQVEGAEFPASPETAAGDAKLRDAARSLVAERLDRILPEYLKE